MSKARLYFDGDNSGIEKNERTYSLTQEVEDKIDSIDTIETTLQGEIDDLQDQINNLASRGRYLSTWDATTGLPETNPQVDPYIYRAGDYYIVSVVDTINNPPQNLRPSGSQYDIGQQSQVSELATLNVNDLYIYDGIQWILQPSSAGANVAWGTIVGTLSNQTDLQTVLTNKANVTDVLTKTNTVSYTPTANYHPATKKYVDDNAITFKPFPVSFNTTGTTAQFLSSIAVLNLPVGSAYLGQVSLSDMPTGVTVQGDVEVYVYPQNVIYAVMRSAEVEPYEWVVDSYSNSLYNRSWTPTGNYVVEATTPSAADEGMLWYDTTNDVLKSYDGSNWNECGGSDIQYVTQAEYTALLPGAASDGKHYFIYTSSGGGGGWQPGAYTVAYYPLDSTNTVNDLSGNNYTLTNSGVTFGTYQGVDCAVSSGSNQLYATISSIPSGASSRTISVWLYISSSSSVLEYNTVGYGENSNHKSYQIYQAGQSLFSVRTYYDDVNVSWDNNWYQHWINIIATYDGNVNTLYINGNSEGTSTVTLNTTASDLYIGKSPFVTYGTVGYISNVILENKAWSGTEVSDYFNNTKGNYGIN